jgi:4-hydroxybutyrate CoA-transferase
MSWERIYKEKLISIGEAASVIKSGDKVLTPACTSVPYEFINELSKRKDELRGVKLTTGLLMKPIECAKGEYKGHIDCITLFKGPVERMFDSQGNIDGISWSLSTGEYIIKNVVRPDVFVFEGSMPDEDGNISFGPFGSMYNYDGISCAKTVIAQLNSKVPHVSGTEVNVNIRDVDFICESDHDVFEMPDAPPDEIEAKIGNLIAERIDDGSIIQIGLGGIANAVGHLLYDKKELGIHTELWTNSMTALVKKGVVTNSRNTLSPGKTYTSICVGSKETYDFINRNPMLHFTPTKYTNHISTLAQVDNLIAINNALVVDLTGQICSESLGWQQYSATGGQLDFCRGAHASKGGKSFIALSATVTSKTKGKVTRIVHTMPPGSVITVPRTDAGYVVTEFGVADLRGKPYRERAREMVAIADPEFRDELIKVAKERGLWD